MREPSTDLTVTVEVPATTANLGPGFDSLGMALDLCDRVTLSPSSSGQDVITVEGECAADVPRDGKHLVLRTARQLFSELSFDPGSLRLDCMNGVPHGQGLGSSAAAIVSGLAVAREFAAQSGIDTSGVDLFEMAARIEGHPDNVAPCVHGGMTIAWKVTDGAYACVRLIPHPDITVTLAIPETVLSTKAARGLLPDSVPLADAAANSGRAALAVHAFTADPTLLLPATHDYLHQRYRAVAYPDSFALVQRLRSRGLAAAISGAGPTVIVFSAQEVDLGAEIDAAVPGIFAVRRASIRSEGAMHRPSQGVSAS